MILTQNTNNKLPYSFLGGRGGGVKAGSQKDRHRGTSGAKEGFSSIGRFVKNKLFGIFWPFYKQF